MSIPLSEIAKLTNNPDLQKNIQVWVEVLEKAHKGLNNLFNSPEMQQTLIALNKMTIAFNNYINDPVVIKNLENFQKSLVNIVNTKEFQEKFNEESKQKADFVQELKVFEELISEEINLNESFPAIQNNKDKRELIWRTLEVILVIYSLYFGQLDQFNNYEEAYIFYINGIESKAVTTSAIHLRSAPDSESESKLIIPQSNLLKVYEGDHNGWVKISINLNGLDVDGYVYKDDIKRL